jgi:hypothetical protein
MARCGILLCLHAQTAHRLCRLIPAFLQRRMPTERRRAGRGADPDAVLGNPLQAGDPSLDQGREAIDQQAFKHRTMSDPKVPEGLGVHANTPTQPLIGDVLLTQTRYLPGTANALDRRKQPQGYKNPRGGCPGCPSTALIVACRAVRSNSSTKRHTKRTR